MIIALTTLIIDGATYYPGAIIPSEALTQEAKVKMLKSRQIEERHPIPAPSGEEE